MRGMSTRDPRAVSQSVLWFFLERLNHWDRATCLRVNRASRQQVPCVFFKAVSWLGNGKFWYALMLALLLTFRGAAVQAVLHMVATGLTCTLLYKWLKLRTPRPRPYQIDTNIFCATPPLDEFSFPSGHTLHAVAFSIVAVAYYPWLAWLLLPFSLLTALSRVVLGLHYPSDVLAGAAIGAVVAVSALAVM